MFGDGASNQGTFGETLNLAALWSLPVVFMVTNNQFGMGTSLERHSAVTDLHRRGEGFGVPGMQCDGMDVLDTYAVIGEALKQAREERRPVLVEAITYRFRGHSMADPEEYRTKEQVEEWRKQDPIQVFAKRLEDEGVLDEGEARAARRGGRRAHRRGRRRSPTRPPSRRPSRSTTTSTSSATRCAAGTRSTSAPPASHRGEHERELAEAERGPQDEYEKAVDAGAGARTSARRSRPTRRRPRTTSAEEAEES